MDYSRVIVVLSSFCLILISATAFGSDSYVNGLTLTNAIKSLYPADAQAAYGGSCTSCHIVPVGGLGTVPAMGFGKDFFDSSIAIAGTGTGLGQADLAAVLMAIKDMDSDGDGESNEVEYLSATDPSDPNSNSTAPEPDPTGGGDNSSFGADDFAPSFTDTQAEGRVIGGCGSGVESSGYYSDAGLNSLLFYLFLILPLGLLAILRHKG